MPIALASNPCYYLIVSSSGISNTSVRTDGSGNAIVARAVAIVVSIIVASESSVRIASRISIVAQSVDARVCVMAVRSGISCVCLMKPLELRTVV